MKFFIKDFFSKWNYEKYFALQEWEFPFIYHLNDESIAFLKSAQPDEIVKQYAYALYEIYWYVKVLYHLRRWHRILLGDTSPTGVYLFKLSHIVMVFLLLTTGVVSSFNKQKLIYQNT